MTDPLRIKRANGAALSVVKRGSRYDVAVTGGQNLTTDELQQIADYIGGDPDGERTMLKLRARGV